MSTQLVYSYQPHQYSSQAISIFIYAYVSSCIHSRCPCIFLESDLHQIIGESHTRLTPNILAPESSDFVRSLVHQHFEHARHALPCTSFFLAWSGENVEIALPRLTAGLPSIVLDGNFILACGGRPVTRNLPKGLAALISLLYCCSQVTTCIKHHGAADVSLSCVQSIIHENSTNNVIHLCRYDGSGKRLIGHDEHTSPSNKLRNQFHPPCMRLTRATEVSQEQE